MRTSYALIALTAAVLAFTFARADELDDGFRHPPHSAGIRAFWWWLNGNVTEQAITRDLVEMKEKGFNGKEIVDFTVKTLNDLQ